MCTHCTGSEDDRKSSETLSLSEGGAMDGRKILHRNRTKCELDAIAAVDDANARDKGA